MLPFAFIVLLRRTHPATDPAHLRPGALSTLLGTVHLVLWVKYPNQPLRSVPRRLRSIASDLHPLLVRLKESVPRNKDYRRDSFNLFGARAAYVNESSSLALDSFVDLDVPSRPKRDLINGLGRLSQFVFGTTMSDDVNDLKDKYAHLTNTAASHQKAITLTELHVTQLERKVNGMATYTNVIRGYLDIYIRNTHTVFLFQIARQALSVLEASASSSLRTNTL